MTKMDLVKIVADEVGVIREDAAMVVNHLLNNIKESLRQGNNIEIRGFGSFKLIKQKARSGRNPKTGIHVDIPPRITPSLKFAKSFKDEILKSNPEL